MQCPTKLSPSRFWTKPGTAAEVGWKRTRPEGCSFRRETERLRSRRWIIAETRLLSKSFLPLGQANTTCANWRAKCGYGAHKRTARHTIRTRDAAATSSECWAAPRQRASLARELPWPRPLRRNAHDPIRTSAEGHARAAPRALLAAWCRTGPFGHARSRTR